MAEAQSGLCRIAAQGCARPCARHTNKGRLDPCPHETHVLTPVTQLQAFPVTVNRGEPSDKFPTFPGTLRRFNRALRINYILILFFESSGYGPGALKTCNILPFLRL